MTSSNSVAALLICAALLFATVSKAQQSPAGPTQPTVLDYRVAHCFGMLREWQKTFTSCTGLSLSECREAQNGAPAVNAGLEQFRAYLVGRLGDAFFGPGISLMIYSGERDYEEFLKNQDDPKLGAQISYCGQLVHQLP